MDPTRPEGISAIVNQLTLLYMEVGDRGYYELANRDGRGMAIIFRATQTLLHSYHPSLKLDVCFLRRLSTLPGYRLRMSSLDGVSTPSLVPPPPLPVGKLVTVEDGERIKVDFVSIKAERSGRNIKKLIVRPAVQLPLGEQIWFLEIGFEHFPRHPRILYPAPSPLL